MDSSTAVRGSGPAPDTGEPFRAWICPVDCFVYEERDGVPELGIEPGTRWQDLPCDWSCPMCGEHRAGFEPVAALER
ncbi:rubredoxin [Woeseia oceani]|uniref:Rubredoxin-like domain-containing protein n=1 Tax=Woeseia oceani TaxID=1548547 RepID=A0A193LJE8_9GAMM|nr:hypothetical protein BA177_16420 [Woeseia oceani]